MSGAAVCFGLGPPLSSSLCFLSLSITLSVSFSSPTCDVMCDDWNHNRPTAGASPPHFLLQSLNFYFSSWLLVCLSRSHKQYTHGKRPRCVCVHDWQHTCSQMHVISRTSVCVCAVHQYQWDLVNAIGAKCVFVSDLVSSPTACCNDPCTVAAQKST